MAPPLTLVFSMSAPVSLAQAYVELPVLRVTGALSTLDDGLDALKCGSHVAHVAALAQKP
jgi:hypothetical protein